MSSKVDILFFFWVAASLDESEYRGMAIEEYWSKMSKIYDKFLDLHQEEALQIMEERGQA